MKFEKTKVFNFQGAFDGMRNPLESWDKSDSYFDIINLDYCEQDWTVAEQWLKKYHKEYIDYPEEYNEKAEELSLKYSQKLIDNGIIQLNKNMNVAQVAYIGPADMALAQKLIAAGPEHRKFLRQIFVSVKITAPIYWWKELDTYKVATVANSTSTMHKLTNKPITLDCFEIDDWNPDLIYYSQAVGDFSLSQQILNNDISMLAEIIIEQLEFLRQKYIQTKDKRYWKELVRWLPEGWLQTRTWTTNYETLRAICSKGQRRHHKLNEWSGEDDPAYNNFIKWARSLPYAQYLIFDDQNIPFQIEN